MIRSSMFDITKSLLLIAAIGLGWYYGHAFFKQLTKDESTKPPTKTEIEYAMKLAAITASNATAEQLKKEFAAEKSKILEAYERDRKHTKETLTELGKIKAELTQTRELLDRKSDVAYKPKDEEKLKTAYEFKKIYAKDAEGEEFPIAWSMFYPNQTEDKFWKTGTYPLEYNVRVIETENPDGKFNRYAEVFAMNNQMKETKGREFKLKVTDIQWAVVEQKEKKFNWWNPRIALGGIVNTDGISTGLNISTTSYGRTKRDMDWRFFTFGLGATKDKYDSWHGVASFEPVSFNIGSKLPLIDNLFMGLVGSITTDSTTNVGVQISIPF
jgi:hypothetical protein